MMYGGCEKETLKINYFSSFPGDEMFSDSYKMKLVDDVIYEVYGTQVKRTTDFELDGANPPPEGLVEVSEAIVEQGVDIILNHRLVETFAFNDKKSYLAYFKDYMKK